MGFRENNLRPDSPVWKMILNPRPDKRCGQVLAALNLKFVCLLMWHASRFTTGCTPLTLTPFISHFYSPWTVSLNPYHLLRVDSIHSLIYYSLFGARPISYREIVRGQLKFQFLIQFFYRIKFYLKKQPFWDFKTYELKLLSFSKLSNSKNI